MDSPPHPVVSSFLKAEAMKPEKTAAFLSSIGFFIVVLALLGLVSLAGILVPQNASAEAYGRLFGAAFSRMVLWCGWDNIFRSPWFFIPLAALCVNLLLCLSRRLVLLAAALRREKKGCAGLAGSFILHAGAAVLAAGGLLQYMTGDKQQVIIQEGGQETIGKFGIAVSLKGFSIVKNDSGAVVNFRSDLEVRDLNGRPLLGSAAMVNRPLRYRGLYFYQMNYGRVPNAVRDLFVVLADSGGDTLFSGTLPFGTEAPLGKKGLSLRCPAFLCDFYYDFHGRTPATRSHRHDNPAFKIILSRSGAPVDSAWLFTRFPLLGGRLGQYSAFVPSYTPLYYSGLLVQKKPWAPLIFAGIIIVSIGLLLTLLFPRRRAREKRDMISSV
jgi:hypothetical protein